MPDPVVTALIAGVSAIIGGLIAAVGRPWGQDWVARQAEERAAKRARQGEDRRRLERVVSSWEYSRSRDPIPRRRSARSASFQPPYIRSTTQC
jgi:hypothetical protein